MNSPGDLLQAPAIEHPLAQQMVMDILRSGLSHDDVSYSSYSDHWPLVLDFCSRHGVALLLYEALKTKETLLPDSVRSILSGTYFQSAIRSQRFESELQALSELFDDNRIPFIPLKGVVLSQWLYHDPAIRPGVDLDILVPGTQFERAVNILQKRGYQTEPGWHPVYTLASKRTSHHRSLYHPQRRVAVELHHNLSSRCRSNFLDISHFWQNSTKARVGKHEYLMMSLTDHILYLSIHNANHHWGSLLHLNDLATLMVQNPDVDWQQVLDQSQRLGCRKRVLIGMALLRMIFKLDLPVIVVKAIEHDADSHKIAGWAYRELFKAGEEKSFLPHHSRLDPLIADRWQHRVSVFGHKCLLSLAYKVQMTEGRRQKAEDRRQKAEDRRQKTEDRRQRTEGRGQRIEDRRQRIENV